MNMQKIFFLFLSTALVIGCGDQDPYKDTPADLKNGVSVTKGDTPTGEKPPGSDVFRIDGEGFTDDIIFKQDQEREVTISARSFIPGSKFALKIMNMETFPDATTTMTEGDAATSQRATVTLKWKPGLAQIQKDPTVYPLDVAVVTTNLEHVFSHKQSFRVLLYRSSFPIPEVVFVSPIPAVVEGRTGSFKVDVLDYDARPTLTFLPLHSSFNTTPNNGALYISSVSDGAQDVKNPALWHFDVSINTGTSEITTTSTNMKFYVAALSRFMVPSVPVETDYRVLTNTEKPVTSWNSEVNFKIGLDNRYQFTVSDPKKEGTITASFSKCDVHPGAPSCYCEKQKTPSEVKWAYVCTVAWTVPDTLKPNETFQFTYDVINTNPNAPATGNLLEWMTSTSQFSKTIKLVK